MSEWMNGWDSNEKGRRVWGGREGDIQKGPGNELEKVLKMNTVESWRLNVQLCRGSFGNVQVSTT